ncbi:MAG TPA: ABC transporter permease [Casimicrobiaceae bacterium]|nr:ABC transporter permease [Casimicrobiaceae bacterium]
MSGRIALYGFVALVVAFIVLPIIAIVPAAFSAQSFIRLPPEAWSLRWWDAFFRDASWRVTLVTSLEVAAMTTLVSVVFGTAAAMGIARLSARGQALLTGLFLGPVVTPAIVLAVALYSMARATGLVSTLTALVIAHTMLALPFVVLNVGVSLASLDRRLPMAAEGLGAGDFHVFRTVTLPLILPGVVGGAVFAFVTSFDEVVLSIFLAGPTVKTLPVRIWEEIRVEYTPVVAVGATVMLALALVAAATSRLVGRRGRA